LYKLFMLDLELQSQKKHLIFMRPRYLLKLLYESPPL